MTGAKWFDHIVAAIYKSDHKIHYFHAGALRRTESLSSDLVDSFERFGIESVVVVDCALIKELGDWDSLIPTVEEVGPSTIVIVWRPEVLDRRRDFAATLAQLRPQLHRLAGAGCRSLLVSTRPRGWFPIMSGSSVLFDGPKLKVATLSATSIKSHYPDLTNATAANILNHSSGSVALVEAFVAIDGSEDSSNAKFAASRRVVERIYRAAFTELTIGSISLLENLVLEMDTFEVSEDDLPAASVSELVDAGISVVNDLTGMVKLIDEGCRPEAAVALASVIEKITEPPTEWTGLARAVFEYERTARHAISAFFRKCHGESWKDIALLDVGEKALGVARGEGFSGSTPSELSTPLDWLLLDDLLELARTACKDGFGPVAGLTAGQWSRQAAVVVPIRNRVAHMRLPRPGDLGTVRAQLRHLRTAAHSSGLELGLTQPSI
ncbi:EKC/KEOPS complex subunit CGI121/TPRKB [Janibacter melonis]|uniref:EKC/KEOPS complex subunit CGI121/TPRKB n=1 Tax=Janibacter melonis TaxID=262209 RepID=UPI0020439468|nr:EKC/KEOPS complex subunit CGI121/TPRKB [Janibacter melonis]MCM3555501.1 EKC/KEOPS complex subunit CGI121/TPRKB [Janibacter melonis]